MSSRTQAPIPFLLLVLLLPFERITAAAPPVTLSLSLSDRKTHVIGDATELEWRFSNHSDNLLAFMWEGCCRINGRVEMKRKGPPIPPKAGALPRHSGFGPGIYSPSCLHCRLERQKSELDVAAAPMGPATAHMFARPIRLMPGSIENISSLLSNWVLLEESGDYLLTGNYLGVHPKQSPQMPKGAKLWTEIATSEPIELTLLSVSDYLAESQARIQRRGLSIEVNRAGRVLPFSDLGITVSISNRTSSNITLHWPGQAEFWVVDSGNRRLADSRHVITKYGEPVQIEPGQSSKLSLPVSSEIFEGKPFGDYRAFVELKETPEHLRTPSNPVSLLWQITPDVVTELLADAGDRPAVGHRNPALKLLRQHLVDLREILPGITTNGLGPRAIALTRELREAAVLSRLQPRPGPVSLHLSIPQGGTPVFQDPAVLDAFRLLNLSTGETLARVADLRRHLGWSLGLTLRIEPGAQLDSVRQILLQGRTALASFSAPPETKAFNKSATAFSRISFLDPKSPVAPGDLVYAPGIRLDASSGSTRLVLPPHLAWLEVLKLAAPMIDAGRAIEVIIREPTSPGQ